jgi:AcrR family transcriptional regulator
MRTLPDRALRSAPAKRTSITRAAAAADQRRRILRATGELVAKRGYRAVTVELIAKRARVSYSTFYKHFQNKEECLLALCDSVFAGVERRVLLALDAEQRSWPERVVVALRTLVELIVSDPLIARACIVEGPPATPLLFERYEAASQALTPLFRAGREISPRAARLPETTEETLAGSVLWSAYQRLIVGEAERIEELLPELIELVLRPYLGEQQASSIAARHADSRPPAELPAG